MPRHVLLVDSCGAELLGGSSVVVNDIIVGVDRTRFVPVLVSLLDGPWPERVRASGTAAHVIPRTRLRSVGNFVKVVRGLVRVIRHDDIDLVHASENSALLYASLAGRITRTPVVWHIHSPLAARSRAERVAARVLNRIPPSHIVFTSPAAQARTPGFRDVPHSVVFPGVDVKRCRSGVAARGRDALGIPEGVKVISMYARFDPTKGQTGFVRCLAGVKERHPDVYGVICGLREMDRPYWGKVQALAHELGVHDRLITPGHVPPPLKDDVVAASDVVLHPSPAESFGLAVLEAMAAAKPVVAFDSDGPRLLINSGVDGFLVPTGDAAAMTEVVLELLADPQRPRQDRRARHRRIHAVLGREDDLKDGRRVGPGRFR